MAMYENRGFCPNNGFLHKEMGGCITYFWERTKELLGDRIGYMVYDETPKGDEYGYFVDAMMRAVGTLGIEVAAALKAMMPKCSYAENGRPIVLEDSDGIPMPWETYDVSFEDHRYMITLKDDGNEVHVTTYKK